LEEVKMDVKQAINERRAYRSLESLEITEELVEDLAINAQLAPSCFNNQPSRFVFVFEPAALKELHAALSPGNEWAKSASLIIAVFSQKEDDCLIRDREYYQFDTGLATAFLVLRATELGLVAHPIAGFSPKKTKEILNIPKDYKVITLVMVGKHSKTLSPVLSNKQLEAEKKRPQRLPLDKYVYLNSFKNA
jgi:nitroreductase